MHYTVFAVASDAGGVPAVELERVAADNSRTGTDVQSKLSVTVAHSERYEVTRPVRRLTAVQHQACNARHEMVCLQTSATCRATCGSTR